MVTIQSAKSAPIGPFVVQPFAVYNRPDAIYAWPQKILTRFATALCASPRDEKTREYLNDFVKLHREHGQLIIAYPPKYGAVAELLAAVLNCQGGCDPTVPQD